MRRQSGQTIYSPSDLIRFASSPFASWMDRYNLEHPGQLKLDDEDEATKLVAQTGIDHERAVLAELHNSQPGLKAIATVDFEAAHAQTMAAIASNAPIIYQAALRGSQFAGFADFVMLDGADGYQIWDTKLARSPKPHYAIQLCCYYGEVVFRYTLQEAIQDKVLTPYNYFPHLVVLTDDEAKEFVTLSEEVARLMAREGATGGAKPSPALTALLMQRSRLVGSAVNKISALKAVLAGRPPESHTLFYCGDGRVEYDAVDEDDDGDDNGADAASRQIETVSRVLDDLRWKVSRFTSRESRREREEILQAFRVGLIDGLVAIKCLDEGIDVPACSTAYILASSRDPRQFIQRRGRILRRAPGKTLAAIHDFIVVLPEGMADASGAARKLISAELKRVAEFSTLAENRFEAYGTLRDVLNQYDLEHAI